MDSEIKKINLWNRLQIAQKLCNTWWSTIKNLINALTAKYQEKILEINPDTNLIFWTISEWEQIITIFLEKNWEKIDLIEQFDEIKIFKISFWEEFKINIKSNFLKIQSDIKWFLISNLANYKNILSLINCKSGNANWPIYKIINDKIEKINIKVLIEFLKKNNWILYLLSILHEIWHIHDKYEFDFKNIWYNQMEFKDIRKGKIKDYLSGFLMNEKNAWEYAIQKLIKIQQENNLDILNTINIKTIKIILNICILTHILFIDVKNETLSNILNHFTQEEINKFLF